MRNDAPTRERTERAVTAALMHVRPDYRSPRRLLEAVTIIVDFLEAELEKEDE
jgi:hypothetical protein